MTSVLTKKWVCDSRGAWSEIPIVLTRSGNGWTETPAPTTERAS